MIRFDPVAELEPVAGANGAGDRRPPDHPTAAAASGDGGDELPPTIVVQRDGDSVRLMVDAAGDAFVLTLDPSGARALGAALTAAGGSAFHRTRT